MNQDFYEAVFPLFSIINGSEILILQNGPQLRGTLKLFLVYAIDLQTISARAAYVQPKKPTTAKL